MEINNKTSFIETYFDGKEGDELKRTITPTWTSKNLYTHLDIVDVPKNASSVLEIGCGIGRLLKPLTEYGIKCYGVDASESMIDGASKYLYGNDYNISLCSGYGDIPLKDNLVDFSYCIITFQHIPNTETVKRYISEMVRVTKKGGEIMFQVLGSDLNRGFLWSYHPISELKNHLKSLNVKGIDLKTYNNWSIIRCKI